jgi:hypothetical protein
LALETGVDTKQLEAVLAPQPHPQEKA